MSDEQYAIKVKWDWDAMEGLPTLIGPFDTLGDATDFIITNVVNGVADVVPLAYPWSRR